MMGCGAMGVLLGFVWFCGAVSSEPNFDAKSVITDVGAKLDKFNTLYLGKLEQTIVTIATTLANIDSNVKNLQERAHVWDTFQLHVAAWNDQISTLDKKIEIVSKGQEKILGIESKIGALPNVEYKIESILKQQDDSLGLLRSVSKSVESQPLLGEFASRGVLSTLKLVEKKLDKLHLQLSKQIVSNATDSSVEKKDKVLIKCTTPPKVEQLLADVASKVDVLFDKLAHSSEESIGSSGDYAGSGEDVSHELDCKNVRTALRRLNQPCKKSVRLLDGLDAAIRLVSDGTVAMRRDSANLRDVLVNRSSHVELSIETLLSESNLVLDKIERLDSHLQQILPLVQPPQVSSNKTSCDQLESSQPGVYEFAGRSRYCHFDEHAWTVIQRRGIDRQNFNLSWNEYKNGFGRLRGDFWIGNDLLHELTGSNQMLRIELEDFRGRTAWAQYTPFKVLSERERYRIILGRYEGNASDSFSAHNGSFFSTYDRTNDQAPPCCPCSPSYGGGWWFYSCFEANLNGVYQNEPTELGHYRGIIWEHWLGDYSLKKSTMMIRPMGDLQSNDEVGFTTTTQDLDFQDIPEDP